MKDDSERGASVVEAALLVAAIAALLTGVVVMAGHSLSTGLGGALGAVGF
jgi:Flp pilus assembly pilin Flp